MKDLEIFIVDDERSARELLKDLLKDLHLAKVVGEAANVDEALQHLQVLNPDVILLDIQMPRKDGFVLIKEMHEKGLRAEIVFITAYEQYAIKAINAALDDNEEDGVAVERELFWELVNDRIENGGIAEDEVGINIGKKDTPVQA